MKLTRKNRGMGFPGYRMVRIARSLTVLTDPPVWRTDDANSNRYVDLYSA